MARTWVSVVFFFVFAPVGFAQGGGVSQTGAINGRVTDAQAGVLAGVTVTAASPSQIAAQTTVTNAAGFYHFPALAPGTYVLRYERDQFAVLTREGVNVTLGFTATVDVSLSLAPIQAGTTALVSRIDTTTARMQANFTQDQLDAMPNARDLWALLAVTPGLQMGRWDIGGNRSGNQNSYRAYGYGGQDQQARILVEGINTTDGRSANGFFQDYGSFAEVLISTAANGAEVPHPGVTTQMLTKSGSNTFHAGLYADYGSDDTQERFDGSIETGGPLRREALWYYAAYRQLTSRVDQLNLQIGRRFETSLFNASGKGTYRLGAANTLIGYYQWGKKQQPYRGWNGTYTFFDVADTTRQDDGSQVWKAEWNRAADDLLIEARFGGFGYYLPLLGNSDLPFRQDTGTRVSSGGDRRSQTDRDRKQLTAVATRFLDGAGMRHALRAGVEMNLETAWTGFERTRAGDVEHIFNNGRATQVILGFPTADGVVGSRSARDRLLSIAKMDQWSGFISDEWRVRDALTLNLGVRFDHYRSHTPEQRQLPSTNGPVTIAAETFPRHTYFRWNSLVPRIAAIYQLDDEGRTVAKASYGYFKHNPSFDIANAANPNQGTKTITYAWTDRNGDSLYQAGEEGGVVASNLANAVQVDPDTRQPYTHELIASVERQVGGAARVRAGVVYKTNDDLWQPYRPLRPIDGYTTPFTIRDIGADAAAGTADDRDLVFHGTPNAQLGAATTVIQSVPAFGRYTAVESSFERRLLDRWSVAAGFSYSWTHEHNNNYIGNNVSPVSNPGYPNSPNEMRYTNGTDGAHRFTIWDVKARATWEAPLGLRLTPVLRAQAGQPYGRVLQVTAPAGCACFFNGLVLVEPLDARRMDTAAVFDLRTEATLPVGRHRAGLFLDVFNAFNASAADVISYTTGPAFEQPSSVVAPRFLRVGVRLEW